MRARGNRLGVRVGSGPGGAIGAALLPAVSCLPCYLGQATRRAEPFWPMRSARARVRWQFVKTMLQWPHEYTVRAWRPDLEREFPEFVALIRRDGAVKPLPHDAVTPRYHDAYLELDGWRVLDHWRTHARNQL